MITSRLTQSGSKHSAQFRKVASFFKCDRYREVRGVVQRFEDLSHLPSGSEVHPEARHGAAGRQADHTGETKQQ